MQAAFDGPTKGLSLSIPPFLSLPCLKNPRLMYCVASRDETTFVHDGGLCEPTSFRRRTRENVGHDIKLAQACRAAPLRSRCFEFA